MGQLQFDRAAICLNLTDMRGISEQISITFGDSVYVLSREWITEGLIIRAYMPLRIYRN